MLRKLAAVAVLTVATMAAVVANPAPAAAIDFICNCTVCSDGTGPGCRDLRAGGFRSCSSWWAQYGSSC